MRVWWVGVGSIAATATAAIAQPDVAVARGDGQISVLQAAVLGIVQGLTEFLPISSTAHLKAVPVFLGWGDPGVSFSAVIQLGSIVAVLSYFRADLLALARGSLAAIQTKNYQATEMRLTAGIMVGTLPIVICGLLLKVLVPDLDDSPLRSMETIAGASIVMGLLLGVAERLGQRQRGYDGLDARDGILMGLAQSLALVPGVSRSGSTITAGLFAGLERATAARFSFLMGIPAITLAGLVELRELLELGISSSELLPVAVGVLTAVVSSYAAIAGLIRYLQRQNTWVFVWYRLGFGIAILGTIALGAEF